MAQDPSAVVCELYDRGLPIACWSIEADVLMVELERDAQGIRRAISMPVAIATADAIADGFRDWQAG